MSKSYRLVAAALVTYLVFGPMTPGVAFAQQQQAPQSAVGAADLDAALAERAAREDADRDRVARLLERPEIRRLAAGLGLDLDRAEGAVHTLDGDALAQAAAHAATIEDQLAGGVTIQLSLVALLLIVIIVILLVD